MKRTAAFVLFTGILFLAVHVSAQSATYADTTNEEYRVYDAMIKTMFAGDKVTFDTQAKVRQLIIRERTKTQYAFSDKGENWTQVKYRLPKLTDELIADYETKVKTERKLKRSFDIALQYTYMSAKEHAEFFLPRTKDGWPEFYKKYPDSGGYISFSNVGFNKARDQALVYFVHWCGSLCGTGHYVILTKAKNGWQVDTIGMVWIS